MGLQLAMSYQFGFQYIRQLCLLLRNTKNSISHMSNPAKKEDKKQGGGKQKKADPVKGLYSWQFFNCIKIWVLAVCKHKKELVLLINPIVQLIVGTLKLTNNLKYYPTHLKLIELLVLITDQT
jgi:hypothetical protein